MVDGDADRAQRVLPDGCVDLVWISGSAPFVAGPHMTREVGELFGSPPTGLVGRAPSALAGADLSATPAYLLRGTTPGQW